MTDTAGFGSDPMTVEAFANRIKNKVDDGGRVAFFLGAGASVSSGIPSGGSLARKWLERLHQEEAPDIPIEQWATQRGVDVNDPGASYSELMEQCFLSLAERQREIERVTADCDPGFAYAVLAQLMTHDDVGDKFSLVVTTNFDDLVADALYLYTRRKPLVVTHEAIAGFASPSAHRPTVLKLHGDALLAPMNTPGELRRLPEGIQQTFGELLSDRSLIFIGYSGHDAGVLDALKNKCTDLESVYWVSSSPPPAPFADWLGELPAARWVEHRDFDQLMVLLRDAFGLSHPDLKSRFNDLDEEYRSTFKTLTGSEVASAAVRSALNAAGDDFDNWFAVELAAQNAAEEDREQIYRSGVAQFPTSDGLATAYGNHLFERGDFDAASRQFERVVQLDPDGPIAHHNYAAALTFLNEPELANIHHKRAVELEPDTQTLGNYALHLYRQGNVDEAAALFERALKKEPDRIHVMSNYAQLLLVEGRINEGLATLDKASTQSAYESHRNGSLRLEVGLYLAIHDTDLSRFSSTLATLRHELAAGYRSYGWDFSYNIAVAEKEHHPHLDLIKTLADVITDDAPIEALDEFDEWVSAGSALIDLADNVTT